MKRIFISGSADGLGLLAGQLLAEQGHRVTLHGRSAARADAIRRAVPGADVVTGDVDTIAAMRSVAEQVNALGRHDAVIHNVAVGYREPKRKTTDGLLHLFAINVLAPYLLTALIERPARLIYLSSGMHRGGSADLDDPQWERRRWNGSQAYSDSKLFNAMLAFAMARRWPDAFSNAVEPGWVATRMGGAGAPDDLTLGPVTQAWLAVSDDRAAKVSARYFFHQREREPSAEARDHRAQDALLAYCRDLTDVAI